MEKAQMMKVRYQKPPKKPLKYSEIVFLVCVFGGLAVLGYCVMMDIPIASLHGPKAHMIQR